MLGTAMWGMFRSRSTPVSSAGPKQTTATSCPRAACCPARSARCKSAPPISPGGLDYGAGAIGDDLQEIARVRHLLRENVGIPVVDVTAAVVLAIERLGQSEPYRAGAKQAEGPVVLAFALCHCVLVRVAATGVEPGCGWRDR